MLCGAWITRTMVFRGVPLKCRRAGECGVIPSSPMVTQLCTWSEMVAATTKKSYTEPLQVGAVGAWMTPPTF